MRWVVGLLAGCRGGEDGETGLPTETTETGGGTDTNTGTPPLPPCPWAGSWESAQHDCEGSETLSLSASLGDDCVLVLVASRYAQDSSSPYPPLCSTTERIELRYDDPSATWRATSLEQGEDLEGCYTNAVGEYPLGVVAISLVEETLTLDFAPSPWSLSECAATEVVLFP